MTKIAERSWFKTWVLSLGLAWCATIIAVVAWWWSDSGRLGGGEPLRFSADDLLVDGAQFRRRDGRLVVEELSRDTRHPDYLLPEYAAVVWTGPNYREVHPYRYVICRCGWNRSDTSIRFMWQSGRFSEPASVELAAGPGGAVAVPASSSDWNGTVFALGILLRGDEDTGFTVEALELHPDSAWMRFRSAWAHWLAFDPWDMRSINTIGKDAEGAPSLVLISLVAGVLSIALFVVIGVSRGTAGMLPGVVLLAVMSWMLLDVRWFVHLSQQVALTAREYAGLSVEARVANAQYAPIVDLAEQVKAAVSSDRSTVFMVTDNPEARYFVERLAFHLYPLNVLNFKRRFWLFRNNVLPGEYVLVLEKPGDVTFSAEDSELRWNGKGRVCAERMFSRPAASLYRVCTPEA